MKIAHLAVVTPGRCGLYETTREVVCAMRGLGVDSRIVDPTIAKNTLHPRTPQDRGAPLEADLEFAKAADLIVNHSGLGDELESLKTPIVHIAHGRPKSSFLTEVSGGTPIYSYHYRKNQDARFQAVVTFWPQHIPYLNVMFPDVPVRHVPAPVDLERWTPDGPSGYAFHGHQGDINCVVADVWRDDVDPFDCLNAFALWARHQKGARLHIYGNNRIKRGWSALIRRIADDGNMGEWCGWVKGLDHVYRAATMVLTPHSIDTRTVREAMACGCPVVRIRDVHLDQTRMTFARNANRQMVRRQAQEQFDPRATAGELLDVIHEFRIAA